MALSDLCLVKRPKWPRLFHQTSSPENSPRNSPEYPAARTATPLPAPASVSPPHPSTPPKTPRIAALISQFRQPLHAPPPPISHSAPPHPRPRSPNAAPLPAPTASLRR